MSAAESIAGQATHFDPASMSHGDALQTERREPRALLTAPQPFTGTRGDSPGPRGCWAVKKSGDPCGAARRSDGDFCNAHSGVGLVADPAKWSKVGVVKSAEVRRRRADMRLVLGRTSLNSPRGVLKAAVVVEAERLAGIALDAAFDPNQDSLKRGQHALTLIDAVDPQVRVSASVTTEIDPSTASLSELITFAQTHGIELD